MDNEKSVFLKCDCHAETAVFTRFNWDFKEEEDVDYELSIEDAYCCHDHMGINSRFKRAWHAFWAKPICRNSVYIGDKERVKKFLEDCLELVK